MCVARVMKLLRCSLKFQENPKNALKAFFCTPSVENLLESWFVLFQNELDNRFENSIVIKLEILGIRNAYLGEYQPRN